MTNDQFDALAQLIRARDGGACKAARLVLVHGARPVDAAKQADVSAQAASNAVARFRAALALARRATGYLDINA